MATRLVSCGHHGIVYRCDGSLSAPANSVLKAAPAAFREQLLGASHPWGLKVLRTTERHAEYLAATLPQLEVADAMPAIMGCWSLSEPAEGNAALALATQWVEGPSLLDLIDRAFVVSADGGVASAGESDAAGDSDAAVESDASRQNRIAPEVVFSALGSLAVALAKLSDDPCRFAHGDVNPSNVIVPDAVQPAAADVPAAAQPATVQPAAAGRPAAMLVDFDTVSLAASPRTFAMPATRGFAAPECSTRPASAASDIYSFGACVAYALSAASRLRPAACPDPTRPTACLAARPAAYPAVELDASWAAQANALAARCMQSDPDRRPSAAEIVEEIWQIGWLPTKSTPPLSMPDRGLYFNDAASPLAA